jgi:hypothetical protein
MEPYYGRQPGSTIDEILTRRPLLSFRPLTPNEQEVIYHFTGPNNMVIIGSTPGARLPRDANARPTPPPEKPLPGRTVGRSPTQNEAMQADVAYLRSIRATNIRINQQQLDANGTRIGINRPDVQARLPDGRMIYIEYDTSRSDRGPGHAARLGINDPDAIIILREVN